MAAQPYQFWKEAEQTGADLLWRVPASVNLQIIQPLPDGSYLSVLPDPKVRQRRYIQQIKGRGYIEEQTGIAVRIIEYEIPDRAGAGEVYCLATTLTAHEEFPAIELAAAYQQRWEFENALDELEIHQRGPGRILRSKSAEMVKQEIWALLLTHYAIRDLICQAADSTGIDPDRLSFIRSLRVIRRQITDQAAFSPGRLNTARATTIAEITERPNPPRRHRSIPRVIKRLHTHGHRLKRPPDTTTKHPGPPTITILAVALN